ncbi:MAG: hypothetical protein LCH54_17905 [Bacteroidetes bacterium]|nr:hypothetical protein [Bacteroidota bacterium]
MDQLTKPVIYVNNLQDYVTQYFPDCATFTSETFSKPIRKEKMSLPGVKKEELKLF